MEENYNMDDFFKNKLNDFSEEATDWDRPRGNAWAVAQQQLATQSMQQFKRKVVSAGLFLGLLLLLMTGTSAYLYHTKSNLSKNLAQKEQVLQQQIEALQTLRANCANQTKKEQPIANNTTALPPSNTAFIPNSAKTTIDPPLIIAATSPTLKQRIFPDFDDTNLINQLRDSIQILNNKLIKKELPSASVLPQAVVLSLPNTAPSLVIRNANKPLPQVPKIQNIPVKKSSKIARGQRFEVGLKLSFLPYSIPISSKIANVGSIQGGSDNFETVTNLSGLKIGYGIRPNLYLQTGIRPANVGLINTSISGIIYDKSSEFIRPNGTVANNIILESRTSFSEVDQEITVEIPAGTALESGDLLLMTLTNYQNIDFLQIPFGISYFKGKKRWQLEYLGGLIYNFVSINNYELEAAFQANNIDIPVDDIRIISNTESSSHFLTAYLGFGVNYRLSNRWHARSNLTIEDNSHDFDSKQFFRFNDVGVGLNFSLNYRF